MKPFLILVDLQNDFLEDPRLEPAAGAVLEAARIVLQTFRDMSWPRAYVVTAVQRDPDTRMPHWKDRNIWKCVVGTEGFEVPGYIAPEAGETVVRKRWFNSFTGTNLGDLMAAAGSDTLVVCGLHLHACVRETVMEAYSRNLRVVVVEDAVGSYDPIHAAVSAEFLGQRAAEFMTSRELIRRLLASGVKRSSSPSVVRHQSPRDPTGESWEIRVATPEEVDRAAQRAAEAFSRRGRVTADRHGAALGRLAERLMADRTELADLMAREAGKPLRMALQEVEVTVEMIGAIRRRLGPDHESGRGRGIEHRVPLGVVAVITPWNNPLYIPLGKIVPALLHGNTVVWKPSPRGQQLASRVMQYLREAGVEPGEVVHVSGDAGAGADLMRSEWVDAVSLTGSSMAGSVAQVICARRRIPLQAELGGNNAAIVWSDADLDEAARRIASGAFGFAGQRCTANRRAIVHESVYDVFEQRLTRYAESLVLGDPLRPETEIGPLISIEKRMQTEGILDRSLRAGARLISGWSHAEARSSSAHESAYMPPVIVRCDDPDAEIVQEETFAPVLVVQVAADWDEAVSRANGVRQGLAAALFSRDKQRHSDFLMRARAGILKINESTAGAAVDVPFGGWKASGVGPPEHGAADSEFYSRHQAIYR